MRSGEFHGVRRATLQHGGLTFAETEYGPGHRLERHAHDHPFFSMLLTGAFRERADRRSRDCDPASVVFYPEHEPHEEVFGHGGGRSFHVELGPSWIDRLRAEGTTYRAGSTATVGGRLNLLMTRLYACLLHERADVGADEIVLAMLDELAPVGPSGHEPTPPPWLGRVRELLHARYAEPIQVSELADEAGVHPVHLARVFRRHLGCTIGRYVRELRIEGARAALVAGDRPLSAIALESGFSDQAHFTRRFKELTGFTPGRYRRTIVG